jgi:hypothetical protein
MSDAIETFLMDIKSICAATDQALSEWKGEGNLQFPTLLGMMAVRNNWNEKQVRYADPYVRGYVRQHSDWYVTRGAGGGIMRATDKQKKDAVKLQKELEKQQMRNAIEAKASADAVPVDDASDSE